jgi:hypothetical protein
MIESIRHKDVIKCMLKQIEYLIFFVIKKFTYEDIV